MEELKFKNSRDKTLSGILYSGKSDRIIIMCHGYTSDKYMEGRTHAIAEKLLKSRIDSFSFDFSGCGESDNDSISLTKEVADLYSAINYIKSLGYKKYAFYGHSLGALICLMAYNTNVGAMVLSAALTDNIMKELQKEYPIEQITELKEKGQIDLVVNKGLRKTLTIDKQILFDFERIDQKNLLSNVKCPILIIHGNSGTDEPILLSKTQAGMKFLPKGSCLEIINGADHNFNNYIDSLTYSIDNWYRKYFN